MPVETLGILTFVGPNSPPDAKKKGFDKDHVLKLSKALDEAGYNRVLVPQSSFWPDSMPMASYVLDNTKHLAVMTAHRPGFVAPTMAARMFATLDQMSNGRAGVHIITAGNDTETQCDGDFLTKEERYHRSREYAEILRKMWTATAPVTHEGRYYKFINAASMLAPVRPSGIPIYFGGTSELALKYAAEVADIYSVSGAGLAEIKSIIDHVRSLAGGRAIAFQCGGSPILGSTEEEAWKNAKAVAEKLESERATRLAVTGGGRSGALSTKNTEQNQARMKKLMEAPDIIDTRLWMGTAKASGGHVGGALVGTPEQVVDSLMEYHALGIRSVFLRGFDEPMADAKRMGEQLFPLLHARVAACEAKAA